MGFRVISILPLAEERSAELVADARRLAERTIITDVAFSCPLQPTAPEPSLERAEAAGRRFAAMQGPMRGAGVRVGILLQSLIGHGGPSNTRLQRIVNANGDIRTCNCPLDREFQAYVGQAVGLLAARHPDFLLVDDDFRLYQWAPGCFCPLHLAAWRAAGGEPLTAEALQALLRDDGAAGAAARQRWDRVRLDSLMDLAGIIRSAIDAVDPALRCGLCVSHSDGSEFTFARALILRLAGGTEPFVRIGNAYYGSNDARQLLDRLYWTAAQMREFADISERLAESDTYRHDRYSTPARALRGQIAFSLLHGASGAKLWVTGHGGEGAASGLAYRDMLGSVIGSFRELHRLMPSVTWDEPATPLTPGRIPPMGSGIWTDNWACTVLGRLGIPCRVAAPEEAAVVMLAGREVDHLGDGELAALLARGAVLDGPAAVRCCRRGFAPLLGVTADEPPGWMPEAEVLAEHPINGALAGCRIPIIGLHSGTAVRLSAPAATASIVSHSGGGPALTLYENQAKGRVAVFAAAIGPIPFLRHSRQRQLHGVLAWVANAPLPLAVLSDIDVYVRHGRIAEQAGGGELVALFDLSMDPLPEVRLLFGGAAPAAVLRLDDDGTWRPLRWRQDGDVVVLETALETMVPAFLRLQRG